MAENVNTQVSVFVNSTFGEVRGFMRDGDPWFGASDVAKALGYADPSDAVRKHCKYAELFRTGDLPGLTLNPRGELFIPESDVYALIFRSNLPKAEEFRRWVCEEVLPSIRKTGQYSMSQTKVSSAARINREELEMLDYFYTFVCEAKGNQRARAIDRIIASLNGYSPITRGQYSLPDTEEDDVINYKTTSDIADLFGLSAKKLNPILTGLGLQTREQRYRSVKNAETGEMEDKPNGFDYKPTELGIQYGGKRVSDSAANNVQKEVWNLKWNPDKLVPYLKEKYFDKPEEQTESSEE